MNIGYGNGLVNGIIDFIARISETRMKTAYTNYFGTNIRLRKRMNTIMFNDKNIWQRHENNSRI